MCVMTSSSGRGVQGSSARRCLFGELDHDELQRDYMRLMKAELEDASRRWGFDFTTHKPRVGGDFDWVELPKTRVPCLYHSCPADAESQSKPKKPRTPERCDTCMHSPERHTVKRKQTNITDFYQAKRRVVTTRKSGQ